ncbi:hypothetical protein BDB01DRAFT_804741 [Pilobolus umbonatus]|nr:hypothetical protein BDB01DRAFT_804741 [Pilobolus umbonatus]
MFLILCMCFLFIVVEANSYGRKGVARMMEFNQTLDKRERGTWYNGEDLRNAACYDRNGLQPFHATPYDMIGAMAMHQFEHCFKCMQITNNQSPHLKVIVRIVDKCAGCRIGRAIDLTPAAFQIISPGRNLRNGVLDISFKAVPCSRMFP